MAIKAKLTTFDTTMIVVSLVIGIGIFRTPAMVAASVKSPVLFILAWFIGGLISLMGALTFAEVGSRFPKPGAYYQVVAENYHSSLAFMLNWAGILVVQGAGAAAVAIIGAEYLNPVLLPRAYQTQTAVLLTAGCMVFLLFIINFLGIKTGAWAQNFLSLLKVLMIGAIVAAAFIRKGGAAMPQSGPDLPSNWVFALGVGLISVFYTYGGYQCTINFGADVKGASKNMPRAIVMGIIIIISCYLLVNFAYIKVLGITGVAEAKLVAADVAAVCFGKAGHLFVSLVIFLSAMGFVNVTLMHVPRSIYAMAEDKALPSLFKRVNSRTQVQEFALTFFVATIIFSLIFLGTFEKIVNYVMFFDSLNIALVASTIFFLRFKAQKNKELYTGYRVPLYPVLPAVFIAFLVLISFNVLLTEMRSALFGTLIFLSGFPVFCLMRKLYKRKNSQGNGETQ